MVFYNIEETDYENPEEVIRRFICRKLRIPQGENMAIQRAHRLGKRNDDDMHNNRARHGQRARQGQGARHGRPSTRPIIVCFRDYADTDLIMSGTKALKDSGYGISRDYPHEINSARKTLWGRCQQARKRGQKATILYPAKLLINGQITEDAFPEWNTVLYGRASVTPDIRRSGSSEEVFRTVNGNNGEDRGYPVERSSPRKQQDAFTRDSDPVGVVRGQSEEHREERTSTASLRRSSTSSL